APTHHHPRRRVTITSLTHVPKQARTRGLLMHCRIALSAAVFAIGLQGAGRAETPAEFARQHVPELVEVYREFHRQPELSSQEERTAAWLAGFWKQAGIEVHTGIGGHGVLGLIKNGTGPTLMLRTDLDALPVVENTGLTYASQVKVKNKDGSETGVMH